MSEVIAADLLRSLIERVERLNEEKKAITEDIKEVFAEAKAQGFQPKAMREIIKLRAMAAVIERELMISESLLADPATLRKIKSQRIARAVLKAMEGE